MKYTKGKNPNSRNGFKKNCIPWNKEMKLSEEYKRKISLSCKKHKLTEKQLKNLDKGRKNYTKERSKKVTASRRNNNKEWVSQKTKKKLRLKRQEQILKNGGGPSFGKNEKRILDELELNLNKKIIRQYTVSGYWIDGYIPELNLAIEIDEPFHIKRRNKDRERENCIKKELNCEFLRIKCE